MRRVLFFLLLQTKTTYMTVPEPTVDAKPRLPVTLLSGFLGAGKTTLLQHILKNKQDLKCAVIVNDMASINIDASLVEKGMILQQEEKLVKFQNGCICCTLRGDLMAEIGRLSQEHEFDYLVIESTGISEPMQVAETFAMTPEEIAQLGESEDGAVINAISDLAVLDTCVTVVDATTLIPMFEETQFLHQKFEGVEEEDERTVIDLLIDQIEFSDVIILNKINCVNSEMLTKCEKLLKTLNPVAQVHLTNYSEIDLKLVLSTGTFSFDKAATSAGWMQSLQEKHVPETIEYGISSFIYRARNPFHPQRLYDLVEGIFFIIEAPELQVTPGENEEMESEWEDASNEGEDDESSNISQNYNESDHEGPLMVDEEESKKRIEKKRNSVFKNVFRSKGFLWLATRPKNIGEWSQAGMMLTVSNGGNWFIDLPEEMWPTEPDVVAAVKKDFQGDLGDKRQELVFIGQFNSQDEQLITEQLNACLLTQKELKKYKKFEMGNWNDPWEKWDYFE